MEEENSLLFVRGPSGEPIRFGLDLKNAEFRAQVMGWIREGGGTVDNTDDCRILLMESESRSLPDKNDGDVFSANYIKDCVKENELLNIGEYVDEPGYGKNFKYRLNRKTIFEDYDPMDIVKGKKKWSDLSRKLSAKIRSPRKPDIAVEEILSDADEKVIFKKKSAEPDQNVNDKKLTLNSATSSSSSDAFRVRVKPSEAIKAAVKEANRERESASKVSAWLRKNPFQTSKPESSTQGQDISIAGLVSRAPYSRKEEISIIKDIVKNFGYNRVRGNDFWKEIEKRGVACKGYRSWQSMRERFNKIILKNIHINYKNEFDDKVLNNFEKCIKKIPVEGPPSADTSDNEIHETDELRSNASSKSSAKRDTKKVREVTKAKDIDASGKDNDDDDIRSNASTEIFPENLSSIPTSPEKTSKDKVAIKKSTPISEKSTPKKKKRQLWSENQNDDISLLSDTRSTSKAMKRAREDYLKSPKPSTSKASVKSSPKVKIPKPSTSKANMKSPFKKPFSTQEKDQSEDDDDDLSSVKSSEEHLSVVSTASSKGNPYIRSEEKKILDWIIKTGRYSEVKGIAMWRILEASNEVPGRSYQSMKERFRKHIANDIQHYGLKEDEVAKFKLYDTSAKRKGKKKKY